MAGDDVSWLVKDFNVLYRVIRDLLRAVGKGDTDTVARALDDVAAQMMRLAPAFAMTEVARMAAQIGQEFGATPEDIDRALARHDEAKAKGQS